MTNSKNTDSQIILLSDLSTNISHISSIVYRNDENIQNIEKEINLINQNIDDLIDKVHDLELQIKDISCKANSTESIISRIADWAFKIVVILTSAYLLYVLRLPSPWYFLINSTK